MVEILFKNVRDGRIEVVGEVLASVVDVDVVVGLMVAGAVALMMV